MRKWVVSNIDKEPTSMFRNIYEVLHKSLDPKSIPQSVLILAAVYPVQSIFVADQEINMVVCLAEIMANCKFK